MALKYSLQVFVFLQLLDDLPLEFHNHGILDELDVFVVGDVLTLSGLHLDQDEFFFSEEIGIEKLLEQGEALEIGLCLVELAKLVACDFEDLDLEHRVNGAQVPLIERFAVDVIGYQLDLLLEALFFVREKAFQELLLLLLRINDIIQEEFVSLLLVLEHEDLFAHGLVSFLHQQGNHSVFGARYHIGEEVVFDFSPLHSKLRPCLAVIPDEVSLLVQERTPVVGVALALFRVDQSLEASQHRREVVFPEYLDLRFAETKVRLECVGQQALLVQ